MADKQKPPGEWLSPEDLAAELGVPVATVYDWNRTGSAPRRIKVGKHVRYARSDVDAWVESHLVLDASGLDDAGEH